jgi:hypothetical protein
VQLKYLYVCSYMFWSTWTILRECMLSLAKATILWNWSVKIHRYMTCGVVATTISGCGVCTVCRVVCDWTAHSTHITTWNICCHNTANHITMYFYWSIPQNCSFSKVQHKLPEDGPSGLKHVGANIEIF